MKELTTILYLIFIVINNNIYAQKNESGGAFKSKDYVFSTKNLYKPFKITDVTAVRLSVKTIHCKDPQNRYIFYPEKKDGDNINLFDLLIWAIKEKKLPAYSPNGTSEFDYPISWNEIEKSYFSKDTIQIEDASTGEMKFILQDKFDMSGVDGYLMLESTIFGKNNKILAKRPIGICPILYSVRIETGDTVKRKLFWVYYPDLMDMLTKHVPAAKIKGVKSTNDFFVKNMYKADMFPYYHLYSEIVDEWVMGDTANTVKNGFNVSWLYNHIKEGVYVPVLNTFYQGNPEIKPGYNWAEADEPQLDPNTIECAKYTYKTIDLRDVENCPLYFPETPFRQQKSLIDVILFGIENGDIEVYLNESEESSFEVPMTFNQIDHNMGVRTDTMYIEDVETGESIIKVVKNEKITTEIKKYIIKEVEFYDNAGKLIRSKPVALYAVREYKRFVEFEEQDEYFKTIVFCVPLNDKNVKKILNENFVYMFEPNGFDSYYSFFAKKRYKVQKTEVKPVSIASALKEYSFPELPKGLPVYTKPGDLSISVSDAKIVLRKISVTDTANYQLFLPEIPSNGLKNYIEWIIKEVSKGNNTAFEYTEDGKFSKQLELQDVNIAFGIVNDSVYVEDVETGTDRLIVIPGVLRPDQIKSYIVKELHINGKVIICGISPVREYQSYDWSSGQESLRIANTIWIPFTKNFVNAMSGQEIYRGNCEPGKTFYDFFAGQKYKGEVISEKEVKAEEVKAILDKLN